MVFIQRQCLLIAEQVSCPNLLLCYLISLGINGHIRPRAFLMTKDTKGRVYRTKSKNTAGVVI